MLDDPDSFFDCKGCGGTGVVGGVHRSVVTCSSCGGFGFEPTARDPEFDEKAFELEQQQKQDRQRAKERTKRFEKFRPKLTVSQRRFIELTRKRRRYR